jgi:hypothetical protein
MQQQAVIRLNTADATVANVTAMSGPGSDGLSHANRRMTPSVLAAMVSDRQSVSVATPRKPRTSSTIEPLSNEVPVLAARPSGVAAAQERGGDAGVDDDEADSARAR